MAIQTRGPLQKHLIHQKFDLTLTQYGGVGVAANASFPNRACELVVIIVYSLYS